MLASISLILIVITVVVSFVAWQKPHVLDSFTMNPYRIVRRNEYWRFLTSGFIHADFAHLFFNLFSFFFFGYQLEQIFSILFPEIGAILFVLFYLSSIIVADLPTFFKQKSNPYYNSLGASGAVSAVIFAGILFFPVEKIYLFGFVGIPGFVYAGLFTWYSIAMDKKGGGNINHSAHLYGGLYGWIFITLLYPKVWINFVQQILSAI